MSHLLKVEPVRIYMVLVAVLALVAHYVPDLPTPLIVALIAAVLGVGEGVRATVTPNERVPSVDAPNRVHTHGTDTWEYRG